LYELEENDNDNLIPLNKEYDTFFSSNNDNNLSKKLKELFKYAQEAFSCHTIAEMAKYGGLPYKNYKPTATFYDKPKWLDNYLDNKRKLINKRFDELLRGEDL
jgi:hypothetical protein